MPGFFPVFFSQPASGASYCAPGVDADRCNANVQGRVSPYILKWNSDKSGDFSTSQFGCVSISSWPLGDHKLTFTTTDAAGTIVAAIKNIKIAKMALDAFPKDGYSGEEMLDIFFNASVRGGSAPFFYEWKSDNG